MADAVVSQLLKRIAEKLEEALVTNVADDDPTKVDIVKVGRYQVTPNAEPLRVYVMSGDIEDPKWADEIADPQQNDNELAFRVWPREIGGTEMWWRKGIVLLELYFLMTQDPPEEETARGYAYTIVSRAEKAMRYIDVSDIEDDFEENAIKLFCPRTSTLQAGGPTNQYLYRGKIFWAALTERFA